MGLRLVTPPTVEPIDLATLKLHLRVSGTTDDTLLTAMIQSARSEAETFTRRAFIQQTWDYVVDDLDYDYLPLLRPPLMTVLGVYYTVNGVETLWDATNYVTDVISQPGRILPVTGWPAMRYTAGLRVRYTAGYGIDATTVPPDIVQAIVLTVSEWYETSGGLMPITMTSIPHSAVELLQPHRVILR